MLVSNSYRLSWLGRSWWLLAAITTVLITAVKADSASPYGTLEFPGTVEVDLVFPRNDTYAPAEIMPFVFAVRNSELANLLDLAISVSIFPPGNRSINKGVMFDILPSNLSKSDPYFGYRFNDEFKNSEGTWAFVWKLRSTKCIPDIFGHTDTDITYQTNFLLFTTKNGAKQPDLGAIAADNDNCDKSQTFTFRINGSSPYGYADKRCAHLDESSGTPALGPCGVMDGTAASSISASIQETVCAVLSGSSKATCFPDDESAAHQLAPTSIGRMVQLLLVASCYWLLGSILYS